MKHVCSDCKYYGYNCKQDYCNGGFPFDWIFFGKQDWLENLCPRFKNAAQQEGK